MNEEERRKMTENWFIERAKEAGLGEDIISKIPGCPNMSYRKRKRPKNTAELKFRFDDGTTKKVVYELKEA